MAFSRGIDMRHKWYLWVLIAGFLCGLAGCDWNDKAELHIRGSEFGWQTLGLLAIALLTPFQAVLKPFLKMLQPIVVALQKLGILKKPAEPDTTPDEFTLEEFQQMVAELLKMVARLQDSPQGVDIASLKDVTALLMLISAGVNPAAINQIMAANQAKAVASAEAA